MAKQTVSAPVSEEMHSTIEDRAKKEGETKADAIRHYLRKGVESERQAATDGGRAPVRYSFIELLTVTVLLSTAITYVLAIGAGMDLLTEAFSMTGASAILLAVLFGQSGWDAITGDGRANA